VSERKKLGDTGTPFKPGDVANANKGGQFKPGQSGNPGHKLKQRDAYHLPQVCRIKCRGTAEKVWKIAENENIDPRTRLKAYEMLWDRGYGKPVAWVAQTNDNDPLNLTDAQLATIAAGGSPDAAEPATGPTSVN